MISIYFTKLMFSSMVNFQLWILFLLCVVPWQIHSNIYQLFVNSWPAPERICVLRLLILVLPFDWRSAAVSLFLAWQQKYQVVTSRIPFSIILIRRLKPSSCLGYFLFLYLFRLEVFSLDSFWATLLIICEHQLVVVWFLLISFWRDLSCSSGSSVICRRPLWFPFVLGFGCTCWKHLPRLSCSRLDRSPHAWTLLSKVDSSQDSPSSPAWTK